MIETKRTELEDFIRAQMEGPGGCGDKYYLKGENSEHEPGELLNSTPGIFYSTSILFPAKAIGDVNIEHEANDEPVSADIEPEDIDDEDRYVFGQRYPQAFGISCCIDTQGKTVLPQEINITVAGRYYVKVDRGNLKRIVIRVDNLNDFKEFISQYCDGFRDIIVYANDGISINPEKVNDIEKNIIQYNESCREINRRVCMDIAGNNDQQYNALNDNAKFLKSYKEKLWHKLQSLNNGAYMPEKERQLIEDKITLVEKYETFLDYIIELIGICDSRSFGFWQAHSFYRPLSLEGLDFNIATNSRKVFSSRECAGLSINLGTDDAIDRKLEVLLQVTKSDNKLYLKIQLVNKTTPFKEENNRYFSMVTEEVNKRAIFGAQIKVQSDLLCPFRDYNVNKTDEDQSKLDYLYRSIEDYGVGHLCSVAWDDKEKWVRSVFLPSYDIPDVEPIPRDTREYIDENGDSIPKQFIDNLQALQFKWLSTFSNASNQDIINGLYEFVDAYKIWIDIQRNKLTNDDTFGIDNLFACEVDYNRMRSNITQILEGNKTNIETFRIMNSAMYIQLYHTFNKVQDPRLSFDLYQDSSCLIKDKPAAWRAFQLAFILLNLDGIIQRADDKNWESRNELVDLVWFPTGGGKTEAYLGVIALAIIHRRRTEGIRSGGTTVIMRYTLRLLAIQQFQRAMRLICALEQIRQWDMYNLGDTQISIGLYVGDSSLPNTRTGLSTECLNWNTIDQSTNKRHNSKIPIDKCPYCGGRLTFKLEGNNICFYCSNNDCFCNPISGNIEGYLPIRLCDEDIYSNPPTLLFGTVDKFAILGHRVSNNESEDSRRLFGLNACLPPSLIIQDELHLLLGPLGSAVGLFEKAIDQLCSYKMGNGLDVRPKIISSTATTRNTELQIRALYDRRVNIFPKSGISHDDSFFSFYKRHKVDGVESYISKRRYLGIMPTGRTHMTTQMRLIATIMVHRALFEQQHHMTDDQTAFNQAMDNYHTVINYFNSLKEVGKVDAQFHTEFTKYTRRLFKRVMRNNNRLECLYLYDKAFSKSELTGRRTGSEVVEELSRVSRCWDKTKRYPYQENGAWKYSCTPPDMVLATNMISVGIDVNRFNTMVVNSMPRNFAEYIQASSRVARDVKGLVITLHNPYRVRDLSHFERFQEFHEKLYYYVEPISITPYSKKVIDKYLALYAITLIRHKYSELAVDTTNTTNTTNTGASNLNDDLRDKICEYLKCYFRELRDRVQQKYEKQCHELLTESLEQYINEKIDTLMSNWASILQDIEDENTNGNNGLPIKLRYSNSNFANKNRWRRFEFKDLFLSLNDYETDDTNELWAVPMSLRNIEAEAVINVMD